MISDKEKNEIEHFFDCCNYSLFCKVQHNFITGRLKNPNYWIDTATDLLYRSNRKVYKNTDFKELIDLLIDYNKKLNFLIVEIMYFYNKIERCRIKNEYTNIEKEKGKILLYLRSIEAYSGIIKLNVFENNSNNALKIREYCIFFFDSWLDVLKIQFGIDIYSSPLKKEFKTVKKKLQESINLKELKLLYKLNQSPSQLLQHDKNDLLKEDNILPKDSIKSDIEEGTKEMHHDIFKENTFEIFEKYHNNKKISQNSKTDLSLLFQLFTKDNLFLGSIELRHYIQWLNRTYSYSLFELRKANLQSKSNTQRISDYNYYKNTTLK